MGKTKKKIIETARHLLNRRGSRQVTTNHIAEKAGISPGNLYYHFSNKEEIIRALHSQMIGLIDGYWRRECNYNREGLREIPYMMQFLIWDYRFFSLELNTLLSADPLLRKAYIAGRRRLEERMTAFIRQLEEHAVLRTLSAGERDGLIQMFMLVNEHWLADRKAQGEQITRRSLQSGVALLDQVFAAYYTE